MTSDHPDRPMEAFVWIWLPGAVEPVVAGRVGLDGGVYSFNYGRSYLERREGVPIYLPELPLQRGVIAPQPPLTMASCLRDGAPDAWGRRVIINRLTGSKGDAARDAEFDELTFLLEFRVRPGRRAGFPGLAGDLSAARAGRRHLGRTAGRGGAS